MEEEILKKIEEQEKKLEEIYHSVERTRKYFLWTLIVTVALIILPLLGLMFVIPKFLSVYTSSFSF
jgi:CHASE3 domain sensor protein